MQVITGIVIGVALSIALAFGWRWLRSASDHARTTAVVAFLCLWVVGAIVKVSVDASPEPPEAVRIALSISPAVWAGAAQARTSPTSVGAAANAVQVAPVPSLLSGLEARLAANPNDANGWVLLAQSYAFLGESGKAEQAQARAIALGTDEETLRERVKLATRDRHPGGNWIERTLNN